MGAPAAGRTRNRNNDSQLDFLALVFQSGEATSPPADVPFESRVEKAETNHRTENSDTILPPENRDQTIGLEAETFHRAESLGSAGSGALARIRTDPKRTKL